MATDENGTEKEQGREQAPSRLFILLALIGLGLLVLATDWVMKLIMPAR